MKKIIKNLVYGLIVGAGAIFASCSTTDEIMDSIPYDRVLTPQKFDATVVRTSGTDVTFTWLAVSNADKYILEVFNAIELSGGDSETYSVDPADYEGATPVWSSEDIKSDEIPVTVGFDVDKTYFARVRGISSKVENSGWVYLEKVFSTYPVRPSLNPEVVDRTSSAITIKWDDADDKEDLDSVEATPVSAEELEPIVYPVSADEVNSCTKVIDNLDPTTEYKLTLIFGKGGERGSVSAWTRPNTAGMNRVNSASGLWNAINGTTGDVKIALEYSDEPYDLTPYAENDANAAGIKVPFNISCNLYIYGESTIDGKKPTVVGAFKSAAGCTALHFEEIVLDGKGVYNVLCALGSSIDSASFINCELTGYNNGIWNGSAGFNCSGALTYSGVYAHDINATGSGGGDFIDIRGGNYGSVSVVNSTFYACARTFLRISETDTEEVGSVDVSNCTFNYVTATVGSGNNSGIFHIRYCPQTPKDGKYLKLGSFTMSRCLFMNEYHDNEGASGWVRITRDSGENYAPDCSNNYYYNVGPVWYSTKSYQLAGNTFSKEAALANDGVELDADPCVNSAAGKLYLTNSEIAAKRIGDPRWWSATQPVIVRATELETVTETTVWDFTDKTKFDTETVEENTIIENIRIYAPAEIVMTKGISFSGAGVVSSFGRPSSSALAFKANGVGSVKVTTEDTGFNSTVLVLAAGDRYTIPADGKEHIVILGDLVGDNEIFVVAGSPVTITKVEWSTELTPEDLTTKLATPTVSITPDSFVEGNAERVEVVVSWAAVENANDYAVTFNGTEYITKELSYTISADVLATLEFDDFDVTVVARPLSTSTKYLKSDAGKASFSVEPASFPDTSDWVFTDSVWDEIWPAIDPSQGGVDRNFSFKKQGLTIANTGSGGIKQTKGYFDNNGSDTKGKGQICFSFKLPAGDWIVSADVKRNSATQNVADLYMEIGDDTANPIIVNAHVDAVTNVKFPTISLDKTTTVHVYAMGRMQFHGIHYAKFEGMPEGGWIFENASWLADFMDYITGLNDRNFSYTKQGLTIVNEGSGGIKHDTASKGYIDTNGSNTKGPKQLRFEFEIPAGKWYVQVYAKKNGAGDAATLRMGLGDWNDAEETAAAEQEIATSAELDWNRFTEPVEVSEPTKVYVYAFYRTHFYGINYVPAE